jgi:HD-GYP domain-containing protein (c-di-GMP phosphodiesterase class II)
MVSLRLRQFAWGLSAAVDLVGVTDLFHGRRVASIARDLARHLAPCPWSEDDILLAGMLHDCGVSNTEVHEHLLGEMEWSRANDHCQRGAQLLSGTARFRHLAEAVRLHHTRWADMGAPEAPTPDQWLGNLLFLADRVDVLAATSPGEILYSSQNLVATLAALSPRLFNPQFTDALKLASRVEAFWLIREEGALARSFEPWINAEASQELPWGEVRSLFEMYGECVDGKSSLTADHSRAVSRLSEELGRRCGLPKESVHKLALAGLVHDIGKLRVPDRVLNYPGALVKEDFSIMKHHSFDALDILCHIEGFEEVAEWASQHHERLDGSGYPFQVRGDKIPLESRILAVADVFQALVQKRPYRPGMSQQEVLGILHREAEAGRLDSMVVGLLTQGVDHFMALGG